MFAETFSNIPKAACRMILLECFKLLVPVRHIDSPELRDLCSNRGPEWLFEKPDLNRVKWLATPMEKSVVYNTKAKAPKAHHHDAQSSLPSSSS
eukprot:6749308-Karenia_brevis.AAC.1